MLLYDSTLPKLLASSTLDAARQVEIRDACGVAVEAIRAFAAWFEANVVPRADSYAMADAIVGFVREHDLMDLPPFFAVCEHMPGADAP